MEFCNKQSWLQSQMLVKQPLTQQFRANQFAESAYLLSRLHRISNNTVVSLILYFVYAFTEIYIQSPTVH